MMPTTAGCVHPLRKSLRAATPALSLATERGPGSPCLGSTVLPSSGRQHQSYPAADQSCCRPCDAKGELEEGAVFLIVPRQSWAPPEKNPGRNMADIEGRCGT